MNIDFPPVFTKSSLDRATFKNVYLGEAPWEIGKPPARLVALCRRTARALVWPTTFIGAAGFWFWVEQGQGMAVLLGAGGLVATAVLAIFWLSRFYAAKRFYAAMDAFAEREIHRERRRASPRGPWRAASPLGTEAHRR
jgi:hypothetical protein